jgi:TolA-binding protein
MKLLVWFTLVGTLIGLGYAFKRWRQRWTERQQDAEARMASLIAQVTPGGPPRISATAPVQAPAPQERLLLDAAAKAGEAGEPALAIQLYAKLISRYPQSTLVAQARAAVDVQKKKLAKP